MCIRHGLGIVALVASASLALQSLASPVVWNRYNDWTDGLSNPAGDQYGSDVWHYEWATGGTLSSSNPWWQNPRSPLSWDPLWWNTGKGAWSTGDDISPLVMKNHLTHNMRDIYRDSAPIVRWENPLEGIKEFEVFGRFEIVWNGDNGIGSESAVDIILGTLSADNLTFGTLQTWTVTKPTAGDSILDTLILPVSLSVELSQGDSLLFSVMGHESFNTQRRWIEMWDLVRIRHTPIPSPPTLLAFGLGLAVLRRRPCRT